MTSDFKIIPVDAEKHWPQIWAFMRPVFEKGDSYPNAVSTTEDEAKGYWLADGKVTHVAIDIGSQDVLGVYYLRPNQPPLGAHICNCGYVVAPAARGRGIGAALCQHSQEYAIQNGYRGMQYNLVVATNIKAVRLWESQGFDIIATVPEAFDHKKLGYVDAHIMFKQLVPSGAKLN